MYEKSHFLDGREILVCMESDDSNHALRRTVFAQFQISMIRQTDRKGGWQQYAVEIRDAAAVGDMHL